MASEPRVAGVRRFVREHERAVIVVWLAGMAAVVALVFGWGVYLRGAERIVDAYDARWPRQVDVGAELVRQERFEEAAAHLEALDLEFPARSVVHRLDTERERLLTLLARSYVELDKKKRALAACERLVAFDPRNWRNHWTQAETALAFGDQDVALPALDLLLAIHPTHLPAVETRIALAFAGSAYAKIPPMWRAYVDAYRLAPLHFTCGGASLRLEVPSDGRPHLFELPFALPADFRGEARLSTHGWSIDLRELGFVAPLRAGIEEERAFTLQGKEGWSVIGAQAVGDGSIAAKDASSELRREVRGLDRATAHAAFELVAYKACTPSLWKMVSTSYKNLLLWDELAAMGERVRIGGSVVDGSPFED